MSFVPKEKTWLVQAARSGEAWYKQVEMCVAVYALAVLGTGLGVIARIYPARSDGIVFTIADVPIVLRPVAYALFALLIWAAMRISMRLIPHNFHRPTAWWAKWLWFCGVILLMPVGPLIYYLLVFRKAENGNAVTP